MSNNFNKFCIITTQRSGSSWLVSLLNSHPNIESYSELFTGNPYGKIQWKDRRIIPCYEFRKQNNFNQRPFIIFQYFNYLEKTAKANACQAIGFKLMYDQIEWTPEILINIIIERYKIIHLIRNNYLDVILSRKNAWDKKGNRIVQTRKKIDLEPITLNTKKILEQIQRQEQKIKKYKFLLKYLPNQVITVTYESLIKNKINVLKEISSFLEVESSTLEFNSSLQKISTATYQEKIANYAEVKKTLENTKYSVFLENI